MLSWLSAVFPALFGQGAPVHMPSQHVPERSSQPALPTVQSRDRSLDFDLRGTVEVRYERSKAPSEGGPLSF